MSEQASSGQPPKKNNMRLVLAILPLVLFAGLAAIFFKQLTGGGNASNIPSALIGKNVPEFSLPILEGLKRDGVQLPGIKTADFLGKITVVNVWASWCVPCRAEHPVVTEIGKDKRVRLVGINYKDKPGNALRFLGQLGNPYAAVGTDFKGRATIDWGVYGIPETFVVGPDAKIYYKHVGPLDPRSVKKLFDAVDAVIAK